MFDDDTYYASLEMWDLENYVAYLEGRRSRAREATRDLPGIEERLRRAKARLAELHAEENPPPATGSAAVPADA